MILEKLIDLLAEQFDIDADEINENTDVINDLGADSLDIVDMVMSLEDDSELTDKVVMITRSGTLPFMVIYK